MSSELSNALNPSGIQIRARNGSSENTSFLQPVVQRPQHYVPHRSELELAISEPPPPPSVSQEVVVASERPPTITQNNNTRGVQELVRIIASTREAQEIERKRRLAWEQELEAKYAQRQADLEHQAHEMRQQILSLKAFISLHPTMRSDSRLTPDLLLEQPPQPLFVQGSSTRPLIDQHVYMDDRSPEMTPTPSPSFSHTEASPLRIETTNPRKRRTPAPSSDGDDENSGDERSVSPAERGLKRINHHDKRCFTIQHVMRDFVIRAMGLESDKELPDSHIEGAPLDGHEPVRFVWDKTVKQSVHNARMKTRILAQLKENRQEYKYVPDKDFNKKTLESAFDQTYVTFRQKFKAQRNSSVAVISKRREDVKASRARRSSRKKLKLANRSDSRNRIEAFEHVTFDGALRIECMSSEESDGPQSSILRTRGFPWRSGRLQRFFDMLDEDDKLEKTLKPRRGIGRKERYVGPPKDGFPLPPKGVASWMVSRRWINTMESDHPELLDLLKENIVDPPGFDWAQFHGLGAESDDEVPTLTSRDAQRHYTPQGTASSSSLQYALST